MSYISRVYGVSPTYAGTGIGVLNTLASIQEFGNAFTVSSLNNTENKSFVDYINEIRQYQDVKYAMEINAPAIIKDIRVQEALDGVITTNRNNYGGEDTKLGTISNTLYAVNLMQGATFNSLRRTQYITSDTENLYGNNLNNVYNLSSLFSIDDNTGRIPEIDSNVYISEGNDFWAYIESKQESIIPDSYKNEHTPWQKNYFNTELTGALDGQISRYQRGDDVQSTREDGNPRIFGETQFMHDEYDFDKKGRRRADKPRKLSGVYKEALFARVMVALNKAKREGIILKNPGKSIDASLKPRAEEKSRAFLTPDEVKIISETEYRPNNDIKPAFRFACFTGLRYSDIYKLTWGRTHRRPGWDDAS